MSSQDKILRVGLVGTGLYATNAHLPTISKLPGKFQIVAVSNRTKSKAEAFVGKAGLKNVKIYENYEDLINDDEVDIIDALLPVENNPVIVAKALKAGKPICFEKPISNNLENAKKVVDLAKSSDIPVLVLENWLYHQTIDFVKPYLAQIGNIVGFNFQSTGPFYAGNKYLATSWRAKPSHIGGYLSDGGVHQLAYLVGLLGPVENISAHTTQVREQSGTDDVWFSTLKTKNGAIGTFTYGSAFGAVDKLRIFSIYGDKGSVVLNFSPSQPKPTVKVSLGATGEEAKSTTYEIKEPDSSNGMISEFENFYNAVIKKDKSILKGTPQITYHHLAIVDAALKSSENNGSSVNVESL